MSLVDFNLKGTYSENFFKWDMHFWKYPAYSYEWVSFGAPSYVGGGHIWILPPTSPSPSNQHRYDFVDKRMSAEQRCLRISEAQRFHAKIDVLFVSLPFDWLAGSPAELLYCRRVPPPELPYCRRAPMPELPYCRRAPAAVRHLRSGSPAALAGELQRQLSSGSTIPLSFPPILLNHGRDNPHYEHLLWKYQRR